MAEIKRFLELGREKFREGKYMDALTYSLKVDTALGKHLCAISYCYMKEYDNAKKYALESISMGLNDSYCVIGILYSKGKSGYPEDLDKAIEYLKKNEDYDSIVNLATIYDNRKKDYPTAIMYYELAMNMGYKEATYFIAWCYETMRKYELAIELFHKSIEAGIKVEFCKKHLERCAELMA
jgi:TPR repeat protein